MQRRKSFFNNEMEQRFSLRKYTIGLCSVCLGFVTIGMGSQTVKADTVNNVEKSSVVRENKTQDADSATAKPNITPTEKENETGSVATTAPKTNSASNDVKINTADSATSAETKPTKANSTVTNSNIVSDQTKSTKAKLVVQSKVRVASKEVKMNTADSATLAEIKPQEIKLAKKVDAKALDEAKVATDNQFNFDDWATEIDNTYLNIIGYSGDRSKQIVVPNGADFAKAGKNDKNLQVEIGKDTLTALIVDGVAPKLSNTDGQKIVAKGSYWFNAFSDKHLHDISGLANLDTSNVTNMSFMFDNNQISDLSPLANWNTGNVTDMSYMFDENQISDLSPLANWNTGNVTDMSFMFKENQISDLSLLDNWNTGNVTDMHDMFESNRISDLSPLANWNTGNVTDMSLMFGQNQISDLSPLANWNTSNVTDMSSMFDNNRISDLSPLANWNTGNVTDMSYMFDENQISDLSPLANWNTGNVTDMDGMFADNRISDLSPLANWNTSNVTSMGGLFGGMFYNNQISDLSPLANWNTGNVTDMSSMFSSNRISDLSPLANWNTGNVTDMSRMFEGNQISDLSPLANWNTGKVTDMSYMFNDPLNSTINSQSTLNKFHAIAYKLDNTGDLASHSESKTFNDDLQILLDRNVVTNKNSATLIFKANSSADNTYQIKIYNPNDSIDIQAQALPTALGTTDTSYQDGYTIITNKFINNGSVKQGISIRNYQDSPFFAQYESTSGLITVVKDKEDLGSINITYQHLSGINKHISAPYIGNKQYINHTQNTFYFEPQINYGIYNTFVKSAGLTITVPDDVTIDPDTFIDNNNGKTLKAIKIADNQYQVVLNNTTHWITVKGLINVPADKFTNGTAHLPGFGMKYTINTYNDKVAPLVATGTSKELSVIPDLASYHGDLININQSKWAFDRNGNQVSNYTSQGFNNRFNDKSIPLEPAVSIQVTNGVETFNMPTGVNITEFRPQFSSNVIDHIDYIFTDGSKQTASSLYKTSKAIRQMKVYFKNGIQSDELADGYPDFNLSFDATYPDGTLIKNFDIFKITGSFSCDELGSTDNVDVAQVMLAPTQELTDGMLAGTIQNESNPAPNANGNSISAMIRNDGLQYQGHLTNPIFYFKYNDLMVPDLSEISASYDNHNKELGPIGLTKIDNNKIHSSIITDSTGQRFIKVKVDGEYYYGSSPYGSSPYGSSSGFYVKIPISNSPDALTATKDWSWYILNNSDEAKTESTIQSNKLSPATVDGNTLSVGGTGTWQIIVAQGFTSSTETQGNLNGGPGFASTQDDHQQDPTHFKIYDSIINATNDAKSDLVSVVNLPSTQDGKSQFDVHMTGKASLINVMTGQPYDATITYSYGTGDNNFITGVTDWSKVKSIKVVPNGGVSSMTSLRLVVPVEDKTVYDDVGKTIYMSTMTYGEDKTNTNYTTKDGFAVPEKSTILPIIIKPGDMASAKLTVQGQATVHTLIHYKDANGKDVYVKLPDKDKTYNELQDTMKRSDYLQSDNDLTIADRGLLPTGMVINYDNPTIRDSNNTYANNAAVFDKMVKYDFDGDQVIFEGAMPEIVTKTHQAKETIHYVYSDGRTAASDKVLTSITLKQTGSKNPFTGEITWNTPATDTLNSVDSPEITGYSADKLTVPSYTVTMDSPDKEVTVTYHANAQTAKITYIDDTTKNNLGSKDASGKFGQAITFETAPTDEIASYEKQGYKLVSNDFNSNKYQADNSKNVFHVHFVHGTKNVSRNDDVNMTVHYVMDDNSEAPSDSKQTVNFTENGIQDLVTQKITWTPADSQTLNDVNSPVLTGYTADIKTANGKVVNFGDPDINVTVHYSANAQTATITYIDDTTKTNLDSKDANGKFGQVITFKHDPAEVIKGLEEKGYKLVSNDFNSNKYQADNSKNVFHVHFVHDTKKVSRNDDVNMTVHYVMDDGSEAPSDSKQTVNFTENGIQDLVTQKITWTPADSQTLNNVTSPVLTGYTADIKTANGKAVNFGDPDINVTVHYNANAQTATIIYIDDTTKNNLDSKDASGKFGQAITFATAPTDEIASYEKQGYKLVSNDFNSNKYQADNRKNVFHVHFVHGTKNVSREHSASFTVHYIYKGGRQAKPDHEQSLSFTENGIQDLVTQKITWTPADSQKFDDVGTPVITGYTPYQDKVVGQTANFETGDREVTVTYLPNVQLGHINYIDDNTNKTLTRDDFSGRTNEHEDYTSIDRIQEFENKGYVFVSSDYPDGGFNFDDNDQQDQVFNVHLKHGTTTVTPDNPGHPGEPVDPKNPEGPKYPNGTELDQVKRTGTQTIHYVGAGDKTPADNKQTFIFTREITFDNVTREIISKTPWNVKSHTFGNVDTPVIPGYHTDTAVAGGATVTPDDLNKVIIVTYAPDGGSGDNPGSNGGGDQGTTSAPEPVPEPTPSPDDQPDTTLPSDNNTNKDVEKDKQDKPEEVKKARKIIKTRITKQEHIGNAEKAEHLTEQKHNDQTVVSPVKNEANEPQLPQTGEANTSVIGLLGMLVAGFAEILGFESSRSRKHKN